ncbi:TetR family transcriptional regulator C-terminal domain-containing protein [Ornithinibacillus xuwenensis]|uniref:TetR family transcriptional regulator C-terminal domain-containing protein n=1 Tax=Ornithinibacillus xuwenensis TaxID=3144668 RepID=A0ABU9XE82_9BACI
MEKGNTAKNTYVSPTEKLHAIIKSFVQVFDLYKPHISVFYQENVYLKSNYEELIKTKRDQFKEIIIDTIREGKESGEFRQDLSEVITGMAILGMVNWTYKWYKTSGENTIDEIGDIYVDFIMRGIINQENVSALF